MSTNPNRKRIEKAEEALEALPGDLRDCASDLGDYAALTAYAVESAELLGRPDVAEIATRAASGIQCLAKILDSLSVEAGRSNSLRVN